MKTVIFTFDPSPQAFFSRDVLPQLFTVDEKRHFFEDMGVDVLLEYPLDRETASMPAEVFLERVICGMLHTKLLVCGSDISFGHLGAGNFALLRKKATQYGYEPLCVEKLTRGAGAQETVISSTLVREAVLAGDMEEASALLCAPYSVSGTIMHGRRLGRTIGFPTVNLLPPPEKCLPPFGVYFTMTRIDKERYPGMTNIGIRPTVSKEHAVSVETYLFDYEGDLYGRFITVELLHYHRAERAFGGVEELRCALTHDEEAARAYFASGKDKADSAGEDQTCGS